MNRSLTLAALAAAFVFTIIGCDSFATREQEYEASEEAQQPEKVLLSVDNPTDNETGENIESAVVYLDGDSVGQTPVEDSVAFSQKQQNITVRKDGYTSWDKVISLTQDLSFSPSLNPQVEIPPDNNPPVARVEVSRTVVDSGGTVSFSDGGSSDQDGEVVESEIYFLSGESKSFTDLSFTYQRAIFGRTVAFYRVRDDSGEWSSPLFIPIELSDRNLKKPVTRVKVAGSSYSNELPATFRVEDNGSSSPSRGVEVEYVECTGNNTKKLPAEFQIESPGVTTLNCQAVDTENQRGNTFALSLTVDTSRVTPPPIARGSVRPSTVTVGEKVHLKDKGSTSSAGPLTHEWRLSDGTVMTGPKASFIPESPGIKTIYYTVTDSKGFSGTQTFVVYVKPKQPDAYEHSVRAVDAATGESLSAEVSVAGDDVGTAPLTFRRDRSNNEVTITVRKDGYEPYTAIISLNSPTEIVAALSKAETGQNLSTVTSEWAVPEDKCVAAYPCPRQRVLLEDIEVLEKEPVGQVIAGIKHILSGNGQADEDFKIGIQLASGGVIWTSIIRDDNSIAGWRYAEAAFDGDAAEKLEVGAEYDIVVRATGDKDSANSLHFATKHEEGLFRVRHLHQE